MCSHPAFSASLTVLKIYLITIEEKCYHLLFHIGLGKQNTAYSVLGGYKRVLTAEPIAPGLSLFPNFLETTPLYLSKAGH